MGNIPINSGVRPYINTRINNAQLHNMYVGSDGNVYRLPRVDNKVNDLTLVDAIYTTFNSGTHILFTQDSIYSFNPRLNTTNFLRNISYSKSKIRLTSNQNKEITIVDGGSLQVFNIPSRELKTISEAEGMGLNNPIDTATIDNFTATVGGDDQEWYVSSFNNAASYNNDNRVQLDASFGLIKAVDVYQNNIFLFGENNIQRWVPSSQSISQLDPFQKDPSYGPDFGVVSTRSVSKGYPGIFFLSSDHHVRSIGKNGISIHTAPGISEMFKNTGKGSTAKGTIYYFQGQYFYHLYFEKGVNWVLNIENNTWSSTDLDIIGFQNGYAFTPSSYGPLTLDLNHLRCTIVTDTQYLPKKKDNSKYTLSNLLLGAVQGYNSLGSDLIELSISTDTLSYTSFDPLPMARAGERGYRQLWSPQMDGYQFTVKIEYFGANNIALRNLEADIV